MVHMWSSVPRVSNICPVYPSTYRIQISVFSLALPDARPSDLESQNEPRSGARAWSCRDEKGSRKLGIDTAVRVQCSRKHTPNAPWIRQSKPLKLDLVYFTTSHLSSYNLRWLTDNKNPVREYFRPGFSASKPSLHGKGWYFGFWEKSYMGHTASSAVLNCTIEVPIRLQQVRRDGNQSHPAAGEGCQTKRDHSGEKECPDKVLEMTSNKITNSDFYTRRVRLGQTVVKIRNADSTGSR